VKSATGCYNIIYVHHRDLDEVCNAADSFVNWAKDKLKDLEEWFPE
jgi:hypothetical protein